MNLERILFTAVAIAPLLFNSDAHAQLPRDVVGGIVGGFVGSLLGQQ